jgi:hypothetical protein
MIKIIVRNRIRKDRKAEFLALVKELVEESRREEGNTAYGLWQDRNDPDILTFVEDGRTRQPSMRIMQQNISRGLFLRCVYLRMLSKGKQGIMYRCFRRLGKMYK